MSSIQLNSDTLAGTPAAGQVEFNGQFYGTDSNAARAQMQRITQGTAVATTSGTSIDFTGIPSWVKRITVMMSNISSSGTSSFLIQIGSGSVQTTGYNSAAGSSINAATPSVASSSAGFIMLNDTAADARTYVMTISLLGSNTYVASLTAGGLTNRTVFGAGGGSVTLSGTLDRLRLTTVNGTDTFDAGSANILYEG